MRGNAEGEFEEDFVKTLSVHDIDPAAAERIRTLVYTALAGRRQRGAPPRILEYVYSRYLEPVLASGLVLFYLMWAIQRALFFYRISG